MIDLWRRYWSQSAKRLLGKLTNMTLGNKVVYLDDDLMVELVEGPWCFTCKNGTPFPNIHVLHCNRNAELEMEHRQQVKLLRP